MSINKRGIVITIPKTIKWEEYQKELDAVADWSHVMNFKIHNKPKDLNIGDRVYLCYNGQIIGWQTFVGYYQGSFDCTTTGNEWEGTFIQRSGPFHYLQTPIPCNGFRGFKYFDYQINESISSKQLMQEEHSRNTVVQEETKKFINSISALINNKYGKQVISIPLTVFGVQVKPIITLYNFKNNNDCVSTKNSQNKTNEYNETTHVLNLYLFFVNGQPIYDTFDSVAHEFSHIYQKALSDDGYATDVYKTSLKYRNSKNKFETRLSCLFYLSDSHEQDSIAQGLESCLENSPLSSDEVLNATQTNDYLMVFEKLIKDFEKNKENYILALTPYRKYGLDYSRCLRKFKNQYKRLKLKIGHILDLHEQTNKINIKNIL